ncbi:hypothetical protein HHI36_020467 [Cryptolaemus montrouzieri]|uniref:Uncharacterized protein n=1 Tax=Cryptolaemus montrouzieri TaxID=559131 RepID=A0ABD2NBJ1_9CUCU
MKRTSNFSKHIAGGWTNDFLTSKYGCKMNRYTPLRINEALDKRNARFFMKNFNPTNINVETFLEPFVDHDEDDYLFLRTMNTNKYPEKEFHVCPLRGLLLSNRKRRKRLENVKTLMALAEKKNVAPTKSEEFQQYQVSSTTDD